MSSSQSIFREEKKGGEIYPPTLFFISLFGQTNHFFYLTWAIGRARRKRWTQKESWGCKGRRCLPEQQTRQKIIKDRRALEKKLKDTDISDIPKEFPNLAKDACSMLIDILSGTVVGRTICHTWYDQNTREQSVWLGKVEKERRSGTTVTRSRTGVKMKRMRTVTITTSQG